MLCFTSWFNNSKTSIKGYCTFSVVPKFQAPHNV